ncbi:hypothetical protein EJ04DRAFT_502196 [Polyplosphaeria fusca]|uniref:Uncharacterized protein n=1 Tax=Polyplosphaeria fusca TaxID=682080 RepID=A0A9P4UV16_9PLEO|nr:hypothetical protein EJ04DRAFT_502196 [Polyplosphaeria fusca]
MARKQRKQQGQATQKPRYAWTWEVLSTLGSVASLIAMIIVLAVYNGREIFSWHGVTLNAVVSVLSTASKALLLFALSEAVGQWKWVAFSRRPRPLMDLERVDAASRGALGSVEWLWVSRWKHISVLHIGAIVTLLAIALDPFSQQLVQYEQRLKSVANSASANVRAQRFSKATTLVGTGEPLTMTATADYTIQAGILNALIQPYDDLVQQTVVTCPTGNCTWEPFKSVAICSRCNDVGDKVTKHAELGYQYNDLRKRLLTSWVPENATTLQLPNGLYINNADGAPYHRPADDLYNPGDKIQTVLMTTFGTGNVSRTNTFKNSDTLLWAMSFLKMEAATNDTSRLQGWPNVSVSAVECGLTFCVNQYSSAVRRGVLYETEAPAPNTNRHADSWQLIDYLEPNVHNIHFDKYNENSLEFNSSTSSWPRTDLMLGDGFNISWEAVNSLSSQFQSQFLTPTPINMTEHGNYTGNLDYVPVNGFYKNEVNSDDPNAMAISPPVLQILYNSSDLNNTFRRIGRGMSNAIRAGGDGATKPVGISYVMATYYRIEWPWIALHILVTMGAVVFIVMMMMQSAKAGVPVWKSSSLAALSKTPEIGNVLVGVATVEEMEVRAEKHLVQLFATIPSVVAGRTNGTAGP